MAPAPNQHNSTIDIVVQYGYTQNAYTGCEWWGGAIKEGQVRNQAGIFLFAEENCWVSQETAGLYSVVLNDTVLAIGDPKGKRPPARVGIFDNFATFHNARSGNLESGGGHAVFADGHVDFIKPTQEGSIEYAWPKGGIAAFGGVTEPRRY